MACVPGKARGGARGILSARVRAGGLAGGRRKAYPESGYQAAKQWRSAGTTAGARLGSVMVRMPWFSSAAMPSWS